MKTRLDTDLETVQREAQLRRIGRDLHDRAAAISRETVDAMAAVVTRLTTSTDYGELIEGRLRGGDEGGCVDSAHTARTAFRSVSHKDV